MVSRLIHTYRGKSPSKNSPTLPREIPSRSHFVISSGSVNEGSHLDASARRRGEPANDGYDLCSALPTYLVRSANSASLRSSSSEIGRLMVRARGRWRFGARMRPVWRCEHHWRLLLDCWRVGRFSSLPTKPHKSPFPDSATVGRRGPARHKRPSAEFLVVGPRRKARAQSVLAGHSWPSVEPGRRLGPGHAPGRPLTEPGMELHYRTGHLGSRPRTDGRYP